MLAARRNAAIRTEVLDGLPAATRRVSKQKLNHFGVPSAFPAGSRFCLTRLLSPPRQAAVSHFNSPPPPFPAGHCCLGVRCAWPQLAAKRLDRSRHCVTACLSETRVGDTGCVGRRDDDRLSMTGIQMSDNHLMMYWP